MRARSIAEKNSSAQIACCASPVPADVMNVGGALAGTAISGFRANGVGPGYTSPTKSGREVDGNVVVVGAGVHPDVRLAEKAGIEVDNGIVCDSRLVEADLVVAAVVELGGAG